jgi:hypothetical protein
MFNNASTGTVRPEKKGRLEERRDAGSRYFSSCMLEIRVVIGAIRVVVSRSGAAGLSHLGGIHPHHIITRRVGTSVLVFLSSVVWTLADNDVSIRIGICSSRLKMTLQYQMYTISGPYKTMDPPPPPPGYM